MHYYKKNNSVSTRCLLSKCSPGDGPRLEPGQHACSLTTSLHHDKLIYTTPDLARPYLLTVLDLKNPVAQFSRVRRRSVGCSVAQLGYGVAQLVGRKLALRQARVQFSA